MYRLIYWSVARPGLRWSDIDDICRIAQSRNEPAGVTGLLLYDGSRFRQVLEGPEPLVAATMDRIRSDPRHSDIVVTWEGAVGHRAFADWEMACQEVITVDDGRSFADKISQLAVRMTDASLASALQTFASSGAGGDAGLAAPAWMTGQS